MVTKSATLTDSANGRMTFGNADHKRANVDINRRLTDSVALRVNAMWQDAGYPGRDVQKNKAWGFAPTIGLGIGKPTTVTVSYSRVQQNNVPDLGIPTLFPDNAIAAGLTVNDLDFGNYYSIASRDYEDTTSDVVTGIVSHRFNQVFTLRNLTRYGSNYRDAVSTPPRPVTTAANQGTTDPGYDPNAFAPTRSISTATTRSRPTRPTSAASSEPAASRTPPTSDSSSPPIGSRPMRSPIRSPTGDRRSSICSIPIRSCPTRRRTQRRAPRRMPRPTRWRCTCSTR
jgi:outer membrane receptor for monomeric catechols